MRRVHPDDMVWRCFWSAEPRVPSATRIATTVRVCADGCRREGCKSTQWVLKTTEGHARNRRKLREPIPVCGHCGEEWEAADVVNHLVTGAPGSGVTRRGRWTRYLHVKGSRPVARSSEERIFGHVDLLELHRLREIAERLSRARDKHWAHRIYFAYVLRFGGVRGRGGERALVVWAANRSTGRRGAWPRAPFAWNRARVSQLIHEGREDWAAQLARAGLIESGDWWRGVTGATGFHVEHDHQTG